MPPQVQWPAPGSAPVAEQGVKTEKSKTEEVDKKSAQQQEPPKQDAQTAAKNAEAAKQHAKGRNQQNVADAQMKRNELDQRVPTKNTDKARTITMPQQRKMSGEQSDDGAWGFVKDSVRMASNAAGVGVAILRESTANVSAAYVAEKASGQAMHDLGKAQVENLQKSQYPQDMVKGQYFEVEKITPGKTDTFKNNERVEDRGRGDVTSRHYHQETQRTSTQSGLEDRLQVLNAGKELTQFEKGMISEWDPQMKGTGKDDPIRSVSPIMGMDSKGGGPTGVQAYKVQRGNYSAYYDRNGNVLVDEGTKQNRVVKMDKQKYPQDMVKGEYYLAEQITPGTADKTKTTETVDVVKQRIHKEQNRTSTQAGLENRLKELNPGKELTPFEKGLVNEWDPKKDGNSITNLSPVMGLDSAGKTSTEVQAYKVARGASGNHEVTYYDRNGNELMMHKTGGEAIPTDGPVDYIYLAKFGAEALLKKGMEIGEKYFAKEAVEKGVTKGVAKEVAADSVAIATNAERRAAEDGIATAEKRTATQSQQARPQEQWEDVNVSNKQVKNEMNRTPKQQEMDKAGQKSSGVKDSQAQEKDLPETKKSGETKGGRADAAHQGKEAIPPNKEAMDGELVKKRIDEIKRKRNEIPEAEDDVEIQARDLLEKRYPAGSINGIRREKVQEKLRDLAEKGDVEAQEIQKQWDELANEREALNKELKDIHKEIDRRKRRPNT